MIVKMEKFFEVINTDLRIYKSPQNVITCPKGTKGIIVGKNIKTKIRRSTLTKFLLEYDIIDPGADSTPMIPANRYIGIIFTEKGKDFVTIDESLVGVDIKLL